MVEGTQELPDIGMISQRIAGQAGDAGKGDYVAGLARLPKRIVNVSVPNIFHARASIAK